MDETWAPRRRRPESRVRDRQRRRRQRELKRAQASGPALAFPVAHALREMSLPLRDALWHLRQTRAAVMLVSLLVGLVLLAFVAMHLVQGRVFPGVWVAGVYVGGMTAGEAQEALRDSWGRDMVLRIVDQDRYWEVTPASWA